MELQDELLRPPDGLLDDDGMRVHLGGLVRHCGWKPLALMMRDQVAV